MHFLNLTKLGMTQQEDLLYMVGVFKEFDTTMSSSKMNSEFLRMLHIQIDNISFPFHWKIEQ